MKIKIIIKKFFTKAKSCFLHLHVGKNSYIGKNVKFKNPKEYLIGARVSIRPNVEIFCDEISIGDDSDIGTRTRFDGKVEIQQSVLIGPDCYISSYDHNYKDISKSIKDAGIVDKGKIIIGNETWIGIHSVIVGGVSIGKHCVIGANSVVTQDIPDYSVVVGAPAKIISRYDFEKNMYIKLKESEKNE